MTTYRNVRLSEPLGEEAPKSPYRTIRDAIWDRGDLDVHELVVALRLVEHWPRIWPAIDTLAERCRICTRTTQRALRDLEKKGIIRSTPHPGRSSTYQFLDAAGRAIEILTLGNPSTTVTGESGAPPVPPRESPLPPPPQSPKAVHSKQPREAVFFDAPVIKVNPDKGTKVPAHWQPKPDHAARCAELGLNLADLFERFRLTEFNREYSDWDQRFSLWLIDERKRVETERHRENVRKVHGYGKAPVVMEPSAKLVAFSKHHGIPLLQLMGDLVSAGVVEALGAKGATEELEKRAKAWLRERKAS